MTPTTSPVSAVAYLRKSTREGDRQVASLADQERAIRRFAEAHGYRIGHVYRDSESGGTDDRPGFRQMLRDAQAGSDFAAVLTYDVSRFGRFGMAELFRWESALNEAKVRLVPIDLGNLRGRQAAPIKGMHGWMAQEKAVQIGRDSVRGKLSRARRGVRPGAAPPFGYDLADFDASGHEVQRLVYVPTPGVDRRGRPDTRMRPAAPYSRNPTWERRLVPSRDAERIAAVRRAFDLAAEGHGARGVAQRLDAEGRPSPGGTGWRASTVAAMLANPVYHGALAWGRTAQGRYTRVHRGEQEEVDDEVRSPTRTRRQGAADAVVVEGVHEGLVAPALWAAVQAQRDTNRERQARGQRGRVAYLLSGLLRCARCGARLVGHTQRHRRRDWIGRYYLCRTYKERGRAACAQPAAQKDAIEAEVLKVVAAELADQLAALVDDRAIAAAIAEATPASLVPATPERARRAEEIQRTLARIGEDPENAAPHVERLKRLRAEERAAARASAPAAPSRAEIERVRRDARAMIGDLRTRLASADPATLKAVLQGLVASVTLDTRAGGFRLRMVTLVGHPQQCLSQTTPRGSPGIRRG